MLTKMIEMIEAGGDEVIPASTPLVSEFGFEGVSMGMPVKLGYGGVTEVVDPGFTDAQKAQMERTADKLRGQIAQVPLEK